MFRFIADLKPSGTYMTSHLAEIGGVVPLFKRLSKKGLFDEKQMTCLGKTWEHIFEDVQDYPESQKVICPFDNPVKSSSHLVICDGNLAPGGIGC